MKALIYCRVSTKEQAEFGYSLASQEAACRKFAERQGLTPERVFTEQGESAKTQDRTQLIALRKYAATNAKGISALIVWKFDRLTRDVGHFHQIIGDLARLGITVLSATESNEKSASGNLQRNIVASFAQFENEQKAERVRLAMQYAVKSGRWLWQAPFGYTLRREAGSKSQLVPTEKSRFVVAAFEMLRAGRS